MIGAYSQLDAGARQRIESACDFLNHKIAQQRKRVLLAAAWSAVAVFVIAAALRLPPWSLFEIPLIIALVVGWRAHREVKRWYKSLVVQRVVAALGSELTYAHDSSFGSEQFRRMDLFSERTDIFSSEDEVSGRHNEVAFALHEVRAAKREKQGKQTRTVVFFRGTILVIEFNKHFGGHTTVVPQAEHGLLAGLLGEADTRGARERISMHDAEFEKAYTVYSDDPQTAHYLLTPKLLQLIMTTRGRVGAKLRLAFRDNMLYVAVPSTHDRFEASLLTTRVTPEQVIGDLGSAIQLAQSLITGLDLETRIWTRV